jgi:hypothetical protein
VISHPDNGVDPLDAAVSGGDPFDLAAVGLAWASHVRITDVAGAVSDPGDLPQFNVPPGGGFDLDAVAALHGCDPGAPPTSTPSPTSTLPPPTATSSPTQEPAPVHDVAVLGRRPVRLRIPKGQATGTKPVRIKVRNGDAAGEVPIVLSATGCAVAVTSVDFDRKAAGAQDTALVRAGRKKRAVVSVTVAAAGVTTPDRSAPAPCLLSFVAGVAGSTDPMPADNAVDVELGIVDLNDVE